MTNQTRRDGIKMNSAKYRNIDLPIEERVNDIVSRMSLEEKVSQMLHKAPAISRLGIPEYNWWNECLHGVARAGLATVFPQAIAMAASFDTKLMNRVAVAISDEARAKHHQAVKKGNRSQYFGLTYWSPNINIFRDPRWGRGHETYGEDPYLTSQMAVEFVKAMQGDDPKYLKLVATPKHFAVHSGPENLRHHFNAVVNQRDLRQTYLPAFKACVQKANAVSIMGAYNRTNGQPCCGSKTLLQDILRDEWGFEGYVVSDCLAIFDFHLHHKVTAGPAESAAMAVKNGCELNCGNVYPNLLKAVDEGLITEKEIDTAVKRLFTARFRLGMFDPPEQVPYSKIPPEVVNCNEHRRLSRKMAQESIVLLKNENNFLPLDKNKINSIAVIGPNAMSFQPLLGNYHGFSTDMVTPMQGILNAVSPGTQVSYDKGCNLTGDEPLFTETIEYALAEEADVIIAVLGLSPELEGEQANNAISDGGGDRTNLKLPGRQQELLNYLHTKGKPIALVIMGGSAIKLNWAKQHIPAIIMAWYPGEQGGNAIADVLFGDYNPAGRLPVTFYSSLDQLPPFEDYSMKGRTYRFMEDKPLYRFGYGLSYTTFEYSNLRLSSNKIRPDQSLEITVDVANSGNRAGDEVVQLYISDVEASVPVPRLHLEGFRRINLSAGEKKTVVFTLEPEQLMAFDDAGQPFIEPGEFRIAVGGGQPEDSNVLTTFLTVLA
jgi:beta-glucosidase